MNEVNQMAKEIGAILSMMLCFMIIAVIILASLFIYPMFRKYQNSEAITIYKEQECLK